MPTPRGTRWARVAGGLAVVALGPGFAPAPAVSAAKAATLDVFAAASLSEAFTEIGRLLERERPGLRVRFNFAGSNQLALQIEQGARAAVFAAADPRWMEHLASRGLARGAPVVFARNRLVAIVPRSNPGRIAALADLARPGVKLVMAAEAVPAGRYGREVLRRLGATAGVGEGFASGALANVVSEEDHVRAVVAKVAIGEADAGLCYRSDVTAAIAGRLRVLEIADSVNVLAEYPLAALRAASDPELARAFVERVLSPTGQRILARHGFVTVAAP